MFGRARLRRLAQSSGPLLSAASGRIIAVVRRLLMLAVALLVTVELAGVARSALTGQPSAAIPASASKAMRQAIGPSAYLPSFLPVGYRFAGWKNESPNVAPVPGAPWFVVKFEHGAARLVWTVSVTP